jgi:hypothetical protein
VGPISGRRHQVDKGQIAGKLNIKGVNGHISKENYYFELKISIYVA